MKLNKTGALVALSLLSLAAPARAEGGPWTAIHVEQGLSCGIKGGDLYCWGRDRYFKPGPLPAKQALPGKVKSVTVGPCALLEDGRAYCRERSSLKEVPGRFGMIAGSVLGICGVRDSGVLACGHRLKDAKDLADASDWTALASEPAPNARACGLTQGGQVRCVGEALNTTPLVTSGPGGMGCFKKKRDGSCEVHAMTFGGARPYVDVVRYGGHICGLDGDHALWCLKYGQSGLEMPTSPTLTGVGRLKDRRGNQVLQIGKDGELTYAGDGGGGLCTTDRFDNCEAPVPVASGRFVDIALHEHACAIRDDGEAVCWGPGDQGQLGNGRDGPFELATHPAEVGGERPDGAAPEPATLPEGWLASWPLSATTGMPAYRRWMLTVLRPGIEGCDIRGARGEIKGELITAADGESTWDATATPDLSPADALCLHRVVTSAPWPPSSQGALKLSRRGGRWSKVAIEVFRQRDPDRAARPFDAPRVRLGPPPSCAGVWLSASVLSDKPPLSLPLASPLTEQPLSWRTCAEVDNEGRTVATTYGLKNNIAHIRFRRVDGDLHGQVLAATPAGELRVRERYRRGRRHGRAERWDPYGGRILDCTYADGRPTGRCRRWNPMPKVGAAFIGSERYVFGKPREDLSFDAEGHPSGVHKRWGTMGALAELATYPSDLRGAFGFRYSDQWALPQPDGYLRGLDDGKGYVWFELSRRGDISRRVVYDALGRPVRTVTACAGLHDVSMARTKVADGIVLAPGERVSDAQIVSDAAYDWLRGLYEVSAHVDEEGIRFVTFTGRKGSSFEGASFESARAPYGVDFTPEGEGWTKQYSAWRREVEVCRPLAELKDVPELAPLGPAPTQVRYWPARAVFEPPKQPGQDAVPEAQLNVTHYTRALFEGCEPVSSDEVPAERVPDDIRARLAWVDVYTRELVVPASKQATAADLGKRSAAPVLDPPVPAPAACGEMVDTSRN